MQTTLEDKEIKGITIKIMVTFLITFTGTILALSGIYYTVTAGIAGLRLQLESVKEMYHYETQAIREGQSLNTTRIKDLEKEQTELREKVEKLNGGK